MFEKEIFLYFLCRINDWGFIELFVIHSDYASIAMYHEQFYEASVIIYTIKYKNISFSNTSVSMNTQVLLCITNNSMKPQSFIYTLNIKIFSFQTLQFSMTTQVLLCITNNSMKPQSFIYTIKYTNISFSNTSV